MSHTIEAVDFTGARKMGLAGEDATLTCSCGATMQAGDFWTHRKEVKAGRGLRNLPDESYRRGTPFRIKSIPWDEKGPIR